MKRSGPLVRRTPLRRTVLRRRNQNFETAFHPSVRAEIARRSGGQCEAKLEGCTKKATVMHHKMRRSQGGPGTVDNGLHVCNTCHHTIHANPKLAYELGFMIRGSQAPRTRRNDPTRGGAAR